MAYKRRFSDDDVKRMEQDADAAGRITAAERKMALAGNSFNNRNNQIADLAAAAHERRLASRSHFVTMNPGAVSPQERASLAQERLTGRERVLQEHERGMLKDKIAGEVNVAHEKRLGMENQGVEVGKLRYGYTDYDDKYHEGSEQRIAREQGQNALSLAEKEWAGKKEIADIGLKQHELEWGDDGGRERVAKIEGSSRVGAAEAQAKAVSEQNAQKNALEEQKRLAEKERFEKNLKYKYERLDEQTRKNVDDAADNLIKNSDGKLSLEDARAQVMASREQAQQQGGNITTDSTGAKWEIVKDANGKPIGKRRVQ